MKKKYIISSILGGSFFAASYLALSLPILPASCPEQCLRGIPLRAGGPVRRLGAGAAAPGGRPLPVKPWLDYFVWRATTSSTDSFAQAAASSS